ncbi:MAG: aspartyl/asparaginyl beta-hydroxylase domain-containing protein, partial [Verrucomicrobia bacterium]|nr:aspartyl/asparaginyl beta-hydroxylase domain-containing protein [Verrucomicrobiota bacterium]
MRIGTQTKHWEEGMSLLIGDTYNHEVCNDTNGFKVVLF